MNSFLETLQTHKNPHFCYECEILCQVLDDKIKALGYVQKAVSYFRYNTDIRKMFKGKDKLDSMTATIQIDCLGRREPNKKEYTIPIKAQ